MLNLRLNICLYGSPSSSSDGYGKTNAEYAPSHIWQPILALDATFRFSNEDELSYRSNK
jgi:hypothetical protein